MQVKVLDLFSGIGGFSLGLERAGMETVAFCEIDKHCQKILRKHWPQVPIFDDITKLKAGDMPCEIDLICGGFPCQDISVAGQKKGFKDESGRTRSGLWEEYKRLIKEIKPRYAIIENVANLRNLGLNQVIKDLWSIGYDCEWHIISARSIGACHLRERVWIIAYADSNRHKAGVFLSTKNKEESLRSFRSREERKTSASNANMPRFWQSFASEKEKSEWWAKTTACVGDWYEAESFVCGVDNGLPRELERSRRERIKQLGNAVVPFIPEIIGRAIMEHENDLLH